MYIFFSDGIHKALRFKTFGVFVCLLAFKVFIYLFFILISDLGFHSRLQGHRRDILVTVPDLSTHSLAKLGVCSQVKFGLLLRSVGLIKITIICFA